MAWFKPVHRNPSRLEQGCDGLILPDVECDVLTSRSRLKGWTDLVFDAVEQTTNLVERTHHAEVERQVRRFSQITPLAESAHAVGAAHRLTSSAVYSTVRLVNRGVNRLADVGFAVASGLASEAQGERDEARDSVSLRSDAVGTPAWWADTAQTVLNSVVGDFLRSRASNLDLGMSLRQNGKEVPLTREGLRRAYPHPTGRIALFVHGLGCTEWSWALGAERLWKDPAVTFGSMLERDLGYTPLYVRYNSGVHVSMNGERLAALLDAVDEAFPVPIEEVVLVGHSMGGLVARSAAYYAALHNHSWARRLHHVFCVGSPNLGAPLEKAGNIVAAVLTLFDAAGTQVPAELINARSDGIKDLRFGYTVHEEWEGRDPDALLEDNRQNIPLLDHVAYYFVAASITRDPAHPFGRFVGDLLVRLPSAAGDHPEPAKKISFRLGRVIGGVHHLLLANHPDVYEQIRAWLEASRNGSHTNA